MLKTIYSFLLVFLIFSSCQAPKKDTLFTLTDPQETQLVVENTIESSNTLNVFKYRNFYNGEGSPSAMSITMALPMYT